MFDFAKEFEFDDPLLRADQVAELLGMAEQTLAVWRHRKNNGMAAPDLAWIKVGRKAIRYRLSDVKKFIDLNRHADSEKVPADSLVAGDNRSPHDLRRTSAGPRTTSSNGLSPRCVSHGPDKNATSPPSLNGLQKEIAE